MILSSQYSVARWLSRPRNTPPAMQAGEPPASSWPNDPERGDHQHAGDDQRLALVADHPPRARPAAGGSRSSECSWASSGYRSSAAHPRSAARTRSQKPTPPQHDAERRCRCQRERRRGAGRVGRGGRRGRDRRRRLRRAGPPSPMRSRPRRVASESLIDHSPRWLSIGGRGKSVDGSSAPRSKPDRPRRRRETTTARAAHEPGATRAHTGASGVSAEVGRHVRRPFSSRARPVLVKTSTKSWAAAKPGPPQSSGECHAAWGRWTTGSTNVRARVTPPSRPTRSTPGAGVEARQHGAEGDQAGPEPHDQHRPAVGVADLQQPVVQVLLVGRERRAAGAGPAYDGQHQVGQRHDQDQDRQRQRQQHRQQARPARPRRPGPGPRGELGGDRDRAWPRAPARSASSRCRP